MRNAGIELSVNYNIIRREGFNWSAYANLTHYKNKVTMIPEENKNTTVEGYKGFASSTTFIGEGLPLNTFYMYKYAGVDPDNGDALWYKDVKDENGKVIGREKTATYSQATQYLCGDPTPTLYGGFGTSVDYRGLDFSVAFTYSVGGLSYDSGYASYMSSPTNTGAGKNFHKDVLKSWTPDNRNTDIPRFQYNDQYTAASSDRFLVDASYLNIQNAQVGYTFPERMTRNMYLSRLRVYVACDNIWYWSARQGLDPRQSFSGATSNAMNSPVRTISGGFNITF
jgi:hypothetical protein